MKRHAFTLIELLAVIAIIAILAALLFPAIGSLNERARGAKCLSNERQWGAAMNSFLAEHEGVFPEEGAVGDLVQPDDADAWFNVLADEVGEISLKARIDDYVAPQPRPKDGSLYTCPSVTKKDLVQYEAAAGALDPYADPFMCYSYNLWIDHDADDPPGSPTQRQNEHGGKSRFGPVLRLSQLAKPSKFVVWAEIASQAGNCHAAHLDYRHGSDHSVNLCFGDGHAASYPSNQIYVSTSEPDYKKINRGGIIWDPEGNPAQDSPEF